MTAQDSSAPAERRHDPSNPDGGTDRRSRDDSGRETQPGSREAVEHSADTAERLDRQSRSFDDAAGINPDRGQDSTPEPGERDGS